MDKLWLIIKREYLTRVKKRSFILATILTPLAFALFFIIVGFIFSYEDGDKKRIAVIDSANLLENSTLKDKEDGSLHFIKQNKTLYDLKAEVENGAFDGILVLPELKDLYATKETVYYYSDEKLGFDVTSTITNRIEDLVRQNKIKSLNIDESTLKAIDTQIKLDPKPITPGKKDESSMASFIAMLIGGGMGVIMYMTVFIYGMMVMRSVMEEKTSRIVEVMVSSVKPFQLMMGKIIGVGAVGLTQIAIWAILIPLISILVSLIFGFDSSQMNTPVGTPEIDAEEAQVMMVQVMNELGSLNWWLIVPLFIFYFLGGYFLYASLFAAVGSAMGEDLGEGQALTIPITLPVVIALYIMMVVVRSPTSNLAVWSSIFPLFSPIVMPARLAFTPPLWQVAVSMLVLAGSAIFFVWLSARIYRVGILMYGKKITFRELGKWIFYRD